MKTLAEIKIGETFKVAGIEFIKFAEFIARLGEEKEEVSENVL